LDKVKKGGIMAFITSSGTFDKKDASVRRYIGERGSRPKNQRLFGEANCKSATSGYRKCQGLFR